MADSISPQRTVSSHGRKSPVFVVGDCPDCDRTVLTAGRMVEGQPVEACIHCDHCFERTALRAASSSTIDELGYRFDRRDGDDCDTDTGCRDGECGIRQPDD